LDAEQHTAVHGEAHRFEQSGSEAEARREVVGARRTIATDEAATVDREGFDVKQPTHFHPRFAASLSVTVCGAAANEVLSWLHISDQEMGCFRGGMQLQHLTSFYLPFGMNDFGVDEVAAGEIFEPLITVK